MTPLEKGLGAFVLVLLAVIGVDGWRLRRAQSAAGQLALKADTLAAHLDTSHAIAISRRDSIKLLGDSISGAQRRVVQVAQKSDALDKALNLERIALNELTAQVRTLSVKVASSGAVVTDTATGTRSAHFVVDQSPYSGHADVSLPAHGAGTLDLTISLPPAPIALRIGCGSPVDGIRPATATATGPAWLTLSLGRVEQSPDLCHSPALQPADSRSWLKRLTDRAGVSVGYGAALTAGKVNVGPAIIVGLKLWP